mgnify:FL=1
MCISCRIIKVVDDLTSRLQFPGQQEWTLKFVRSHVASQVWKQDGQGELTIGINLLSEDEKALTNMTLDPVKTPSDVSPDDTDTAIYVSSSLVNGEFLHTRFSTRGRAIKYFTTRVADFF